MFGEFLFALLKVNIHSFIRILYYFHQNNNKRRFIAKVRPPRLNGASCGVYASRAPHRPNPIGLTLAKIENITKGTLHEHWCLIDLIAFDPFRRFIARFRNRYCRWNAYCRYKAIY